MCKYIDAIYLPAVLLDYICTRLGNTASLASKLQYTQVKYETLKQEE